MPAHFQIPRRAAQIVAILAVGMLAPACATKKSGSTPATATTQKQKKKEKEKDKKPAPAPSPTATPAPSPTPEARYFAKVSVEGQETTQQEITPGSPAAGPSPTPSASPSPTPAPSPTPKPKSANFILQTWQKFFPPKPTPAPTPGPTGKISDDDRRARGRKSFA